MTAMRCKRYWAMACITPVAVLLIRQNPPALLLWAWWPGGRMAQKACQAFFIHHHIDCLDNGSGRKTGGLKGVVADDRIVIDAVDLPGSGWAASNSCR